MFKTMSLKEPSSVVPAGSQPLFSKFKPRAANAESPKSVILDPRIVSPASSASASLERRLTDLKKVSRHDRVHSISDADEGTSPAVNLSAAFLSRQLSAKASNGNLLLEPVSEVHSTPAVHPRTVQISGQFSETSSPRVRMSRNAGRDGAKGSARGSENEFFNRRMSLPCSPPKPNNDDEMDRAWRNVAGLRDPRPNSFQTLAREPLQGTRLAMENSFQPLHGKNPEMGPMYDVLKRDVNGATLGEKPSGRGTSRSGEPVSRDNGNVKNQSELPSYEDQIELNKFVVRGSGGEEEISTGHKITWSPGHRNSLAGDGRSGVAGYRHSKTSPGESPGHTNGFHESPRFALPEVSSDFVTKATSQGAKGVPETQKDGRTKSTPHSDYFDNNSSTRLVDGWRKSVDGLTGSGSPTKPPPALHALQSQSGIAVSGVHDSHNTERSFQHGGKVLGGEASRGSLMKFVPGQFLKSNPLKPRQQPAKWEDAEKWLANPASAKSNSHSSHGNGSLSGGSTPHHNAQFHAAASARRHSLPGSNQSSRTFGTPGESQTANTESNGARLPPENGAGNPTTCPPANGLHSRRTYDASTTTDRTAPMDSNRDETGTRPEDKFADSCTVQSTSPSVVMKDASTEITPSTSQRDISTQVSTPPQSFHTAVTPPRIHNSGPARLNTTPVHSERRPASVGVDVTELKNCHQAKLELDKAASLDSHWTTREEEVEESSRSLRLSVSRSVKDFQEVKRSVLEARATAWEESEQSKYMARYHREEAKILAWEAHEKAKAEADMRKVEVQLERMRSHANEQLQNKLATVHLKAENMRAAAAAKCGEEAAKANHWAQEIRYTGRSPTRTRLCCFPRFKS